MGKITGAMFHYNILKINGQTAGEFYCFFIIFLYQCQLKICVLLLVLIYLFISCYIIYILNIYSYIKDIWSLKNRKYDI